MTRRLVLALFLALVLPLAQVAAAAHELTHVHTAPQGKSAPAASHCGLCVMGAAVTGGGAAVHSPVVLHAPPVQPQPAWTAVASVATPRPSPFLSRAPPFLR